MKSSLLVAIVAISLPCILLSAEPSAFGAGNLNSPNPYGLTSSEEVLLQNKKNLRKVEVKSNNQANEVESLRERIDGIQTIIESISASSRKNKLKLQTFIRENSDQLENSSEFDKRFTDAIELNVKNTETNTKEIEKINLVVIEMYKLIDNINKNYVTKDEFNLLVNDMNKFKTLVAKGLKNNTKPNKSKLDSMSSGDVATKAKSYYDKKLYTKALQYYNHLVKKKYKPARAHYMIGEIYYNRKNYAEAIAYFKKSASLYSKASYMHVLMLHTAISMDKTGDNSNAKVFYDAVISKYPNSSSAKTAKNKLDLIN